MVAQVAGGLCLDPSCTHSSQILALHPSDSQPYPLLVSEVALGS